MALADVLKQISDYGDWFQDEWGNWCITGESADGIPAWEVGQEEYGGHTLKCENGVYTQEWCDAIPLDELADTAAAMEAAKRALNASLTDAYMRRRDGTVA